MYCFKQKCSLKLFCVSLHVPMLVACMPFALMVWYKALYSKQRNIIIVFQSLTCLSQKVIEGRSYRLQNPWVGVVNRSQADINKNTDMTVARRKEREYFATSPDYGHLSNRMGSEYLAKLLSQVWAWISLLELKLFCSLIKY